MDLGSSAYVFALMKQHNLIHMADPAGIEAPQQADKLVSTLDGKPSEDISISFKTEYKLTSSCRILLGVFLSLFN